MSAGRGFCSSYTMNILCRQKMYSPGEQVMSTNNFLDLNVEKLNQIGFIRVSVIALDLKYKLCSIIAKPYSNLAAIRFFTPI